MAEQRLVAGIDSSTQSCKVVVRDADSGELVREGRAAHPDGTEVPPQAWWEALEEAVALADQLGAFPQLCLRADRRSSYEQWGLDLEGALANEVRLGLVPIRAGETVAGASVQARARSS